jgi:hypothetical protein
MTDKERQPNLFEKAGDETIQAAGGPNVAEGGPEAADDGPNGLEAETAMEQAHGLVSEMDDQVRAAIRELLDTASLSNAWAELRKHGAADLEIQRELVRDLGKKGRVGSIQGLSFIQAKPRLALWVGNRGGQGIEPTLEGAELLAKIREVFEIGQPEPVEEKADKATPPPFMRKKRDRKKIGAEANT